MHGAVGEEHPAQPVGFQPVAIEEDEALAGFALQLQPLAYLIKIPGVGGGGDRTQHLVTGQQFALAVGHLRQGDGTGFAAADESKRQQQQRDGQQTGAGHIPAGASRMPGGGGIFLGAGEGGPGLLHRRDFRRGLRRRLRYVVNNGDG